MTVWNRLQARVGTGGILIAAVIVAALAFIVGSAVQTAAPATGSISAGSRFSCTVTSVYDGDGPINCSEVDAGGKPISVRLRGIEARESDNSCRRDKLCPSASGAEAKAVLTGLAVGRLDCVSNGPSYNNVDARCIAPTGADISCEMVRSGTAVRWPEYDREGRLLGCMPGKS